MTKKSGKGYAVVSHKTGKVLGKHKTRAGAAKQLRAMTAKKK